MRHIVSPLLPIVVVKVARVVRVVVCVAIQGSVSILTLLERTGFCRTFVGCHLGSERLKDQVAIEMLDDVTPEPYNEVGFHLTESGLYHVGSVPKRSTELVGLKDTYFLPVFCLPGLMSTDLKKAKAYSTGLLA